MVIVVEVLLDVRNWFATCRKSVAGKEKREGMTTVSVSWLRCCLLFALFIDILKSRTTDYVVSPSKLLYIILG